VEKEEWHGGGEYRKCDVDENWVVIVMIPP